MTASTSGAVSILHRSGWWKRLLGVLLLVSGLTLQVFVALNMVHDASLWVLGRRAEAQVVGIWIEQDAEAKAEAPTFRWFIRYQFRTPGGRIVTDVSRISAKEVTALGDGKPIDVVYENQRDMAQENTGAITGGTSVDVVYLPGYPTHNRLDESRFVPLLACAYVPLILIGCAGLAAGRYLIQHI